MRHINFKIAGKPSNTGIRKISLINRIIFWISLAILMFSLLMISGTLLDYYRSYKLNEDLKKIYYDSDSETESADNQTAAAGSQTEITDAGSYADEVTVIPENGNGEKTPVYAAPPPRRIIPVYERTPQYYADGGLQLEHRLYPGYIKPTVFDQLPAPEPESVLIEQHQKLLKINKDVVGWIHVPGTNIDYPVVQSKDNEYYLRRNLLRRWSQSGTIFADYRNTLKKKSKDESVIKDRNTILYGHTMRNDSMFAQLKKYKKKDFFKDNSVINFDIMGVHHEWEVFSVYVTDLNFDYLTTEFENNQKFKEYLNIVAGKSIIKKKISLGEKDKILTLSTCSYDLGTEEARLVVHAKLIK